MKVQNLSLYELRQKAPRKFWEYVREDLNRSGIPTHKGEQWEKSAQLSQHWKRNETELAQIISKLIGEEIPESKPEGAEECSFVPKLSRGQRKQSDAVSREEFEQVKVAIEELRSFYQTGQKASEGQRPLAPTPPQEGKKFTIKREKIGITIDPVLKELLEKESKERGINMSRLLDTVIWYYYNCPPFLFRKNLTNLKGKKNESSGKKYL